MPDRHGKLTDHFCRSLVLDKSETDLDYCQPIASRRVTEEVSKNARRAAVMIGCFTVKRRVKLRPEVVLWRWMVLELDQVLAHLAHGDACPAGGRM